jgi:hypothetical protein
MGPLAGAVGVSSALYLCAGLKLLTLGALLMVKDVRTLSLAPAEPAGVRADLREAVVPR